MVCGGVYMIFGGGILYMGPHTWYVGPCTWFMGPYSWERVFDISEYMYLVVGRGYTVLL